MLTRSLHIALGIAVVVLIVVGEWPHRFGVVPSSGTEDSSGLGGFATIPVLIVWGATGFCEAYFARKMPVELAWTVGIATAIYMMVLIPAFLNYDPTNGIGIGYAFVWVLCCILSGIMSLFVWAIAWYAHRKSLSAEDEVA